MNISVRLIGCLVWLVVFAIASVSAQTPRGNAPPVATYSIVALDPQTQELGVAVQSRIPAVGAIVPWVKAGVGAIATQSYSNTQYGPDGLALLQEGKTAAQAIEILTGSDPGRSHRQVGIVDASGNAATFTGDECLSWAGGKTGQHYAVQGNILVSEAVVDAIAAGFEASQGDLATRLIDALQAGQDAGGEKRGMQSAALYIAREGWGYAGLNDRFRDIRVDDHVQPIKELRRVYDVHKKLFPRPQSER